MAGDFNITISVKGRAETEDNKEKEHFSFLQFFKYKKITHKINYRPTLGATV